MSFIEDEKGKMGARNILDTSPYSLKQVVYFILLAFDYKISFNQLNDIAFYIMGYYSISGAGRYTDVDFSLELTTNTPFLIGSKNLLSDYSDKANRDKVILKEATNSFSMKEGDIANFTSHIKYQQLLEIKKMFEGLEQGKTLLQKFFDDLEEAILRDKVKYNEITDNIDMFKVAKEVENNIIIYQNIHTNFINAYA